MSVVIVTSGQPARSAPEAPGRSRRGSLKLPAPAGASLRLGRSALRGVDYQSGHLVFDERYTEEQAHLARQLLTGERLAVQFQGLGRAATVTAADLDEINSHHSQVELAAGDVAVFERYSANDALMRSPLRFTRRALEKLAADFNEGRGVHAQDRIPEGGHTHFRSIGRTFAARVEEAEVRGTSAHWLVTRFYCVREGASSERLQLIRDVETGVLGFDSITFMGGAWEFQDVEGPGGESVFFFEVDDDEQAMPRLEGVELSVLSELGNVYGAGSNQNRIAASEPAASPSNQTTEILCLS